jgi:hypothetical protein
MNEETSPLCQRGEGGLIRSRHENQIPLDPPFPKGEVGVRFGSP